MPTLRSPQSNTADQGHNSVPMQESLEAQQDHTHWVFWKGIHRGMGVGSEGDRQDKLCLSSLVWEVKRVWKFKDITFFLRYHVSIEFFLHAEDWTHSLCMIGKCSAMKQHSQILCCSPLVSSIWNLKREGCIVYKRTLGEGSLTTWYHPAVY